MADCDTKRIVVLELDGMLATSVALTHDVLAGAQRAARAFGKTVEFSISRTDRISPRTMRDSLVIVPGLGCADAAELEAAIARPQVRGAVDQLRQLEGSGTTIGASCASVALLAEAGLLDGRRATTSWFLRPTLARRHPQIEFVADAMLVRDAEIYTGGAAMAQADLMLALVEPLVGADAADLCARYLLLDHRVSQRRFVVLRAMLGGDPLLVEAEQWAQTQIDRQFSLQEWADAVSTTPWTLRRRLQNACGLSPSRFLQQLRAEAAERHLAGGMTIASAAAAVGLADASTLHRLLRRAGRRPNVRTPRADTEGD